MGIGIREGESPSETREGAGARRRALPTPLRALLPRRGAEPANVRRRSAPGPGTFERLTPRLDTVEGPARQRTFARPAYNSTAAGDRAGPWRERSPDPGRPAVGPRSLGTGRTIGRRTPCRAVAEECYVPRYSPHSGKSAGPSGPARPGGPRCRTVGTAGTRSGVRERGGPDQRRVPDRKAIIPKMIGVPGSVSPGSGSSASPLAQMPCRRATRQSRG